MGALFGRFVFAQFIIPYQKVLSLCIEFENEIADGVDQILTSERCVQMIDALRIIGANQYFEAIDGAIKNIFPGVTLPLDDDAWEKDAILAKLNQASKMVSEAEKMKYAYEDFHHAVIKYILKHFI